ncbi:class I SAM-dependent methyltransferase [Mycobacterium branderi]|uniref:S-adenosyl-L-methionine-dependent methyltransferase n=1 Tax=Mycobacterium branderi TaxID=43348 RepID=A0A7I7VYE6_9MYCO|nr:class I SAM-dependent methyltransferase [Mycobacterium branderi]MCV7233290.1 class I SAM-dependent methyltransferase [Mycobacterium branderi]ORA41356.1 SAM-dependent methyltransferase [Mycobacterium branderi]BBZ10404.1 putative S-adenosyl-L-methionine-dependent methyltransferase [Mycobacterium branderi]
MTRSERDSWDLASSVGATATMVAAARALATRAEPPLIDDPFAEPLVRAVGIDYFVRLLDGEIASGDPALPVDPRHVVTNIAVRTRFFDDFFTAAANDGVRQAVILAAGLDTRAYRLPWPDGTVVFELDQPAVVDFKSATLSKLGAQPSAERRTVPVDLREDWPVALRANGFDESKPTAWIAEGLLLYLPPEAQDRLFDIITALSAPGSRLATEYHPDGGAAMAERSKTMAPHWREHGLDLDLSELVYHGERKAVPDYLAAHNWTIATSSRAELLSSYGLELPDDAASAPMRNTVAVTALLG